LQRKQRSKIYRLGGYKSSSLAYFIVPGSYYYLDYKFLMSYLLALLDGEVLHAEKLSGIGPASFDVEARCFRQLRKFFWCVFV
jgi:hypothetical protein